MRFAVVGCGEAGSKRAAAAAVVDGAEITICVDRIEDRARGLAATSGADASTDWRSAIVRSDVDAVIVATTNDTHSTVGIAAAEAGKHILCERPLARNPAEAEQMLGAARHHGVTLKTGLSLRHHPVTAEADRLIGDGRIGGILFIRGRTGRGSYAARPAEWMVNCELSGGGTVLDNGTDLLDLCRHFMGDFQQVLGRTATLLWPIRPCEDNAFAILSAQDGRAAFVHSSWTDWQGYMAMEISGSDGYIRLDYDESTAVLGMRPGVPGAGLEEMFDLSGLPDRSRSIEIEELMRAVEEGREPAGSGADGLEAVVLAHAIYESSEEGRAVRL